MNALEDLADKTREVRDSKCSRCASACAVRTTVGTSRLLENSLTRACTSSMGFLNSSRSFLTSTSTSARGVFCEGVVVPLVFFAGAFFAFPTANGGPIDPLFSRVARFFAYSFVSFVHVPPFRTVTVLRPKRLGNLDVHLDCARRSPVWACVYAVAVQ